MAITLRIPHGLSLEPRAGATVYTGRAEAPTRGGPAGPEPVVLDEADVVEMEWDDGAVVVARAGELSTPTGEGPVALAGGRSERDGLSNALIRLVLRPIVKRGVGEVLAAIDARFVNEARAQGASDGDAADHQGILWRWDADADRFVRQPVGGPRKEQPALLLLHGTFSTTREGFLDLLPGGVRDGDWHSLAGDYPEVFAFDHPTLTANPLDNALRLAALLPQGRALTLVTHSRGGLVGEVLAAASSRKQAITLPADSPLQEHQASFEELSELMDKRGLQVERMVRVACPARGTTLMAQGLDTWLNVALNALGLVPALRATPMFGLVKELLLAVASSRHDTLVAPGLESMNPRGTFACWLATRQAKGLLAVVAGEATGGSIVNRIADVVVGVVFPSRHDLVVDTDAMEGGAIREPEVCEAYRFFKEDVQDLGRLDHFSYFRLGATRRVILAEADLNGSGADFSSAGTRGEAPQVGTARIALVPDVFGSELLRGRTPWWPDPAALLSTGFGNMLGVAGTELSAGGLSPGAYAELQAAVAREHGDAVVEAATYNWSASLDSMAAEVEGRLDAMTGLQAIIAHGLGGIVLARALRRAQTRSVVPPWAELRIALLGVPLQGTWWAWQLLTQLQLGATERGDATFDLLARLDPNASGADLAAALRKLDALWALLPAAPDAGASEAVRRAWEALPREQRETLVPTAQERRGWFEGAYPRVLVVAGSERRGHPSPGTEPGVGDGRVTLAAARFAPDVPVGGLVESRSGHGELGSSAADARAIALWFRSGKVAAEPVQPVNGGAVGELTARRMVASGEREPRLKARPGPVPLRRELVDATIGRTTLPAERRPTGIDVEVWQAYPALETDGTLLVVGHPDMARLTTLETDIDVVMGGTLGQRFRAGRYPSALGSWSVAMPGARPLPRHPRGVLVVGLGRAGDVTRGRLIQALTEALVETGLPPVGPALWTEGTGERVLSFALVGVGRDGLLPHEFTDCVLESVLCANQRLQRENLAPPYARVSFVDLSEGRARQVLARAVAWTGRPVVPLAVPGAIAVLPFLKRATSLVPSAAELDPGDAPRGRMRRVGIGVVADPGGRSFARLSFDASGEAAQEVRIRQQVVWEDIEAGVARLAASGGWDLRAVAGLRETMLTPRLVSDFREGLDILLAVDSRAAGVPWEAFVAADGERGGSVSLSILRQLRNVAQPDARPVVNNRRALVVCSPGSGARHLPGAEREADAVAAALRAVDYEVVRTGGTRDALVTALAESFEVIHLVGHGAHDPNDPSRTGFLCDDGTFFSTISAPRFAHHPPALLFINACHLANMRGTGSLAAPSAFAAGFAEAAIRAGVPTVIAAGWPVDDDAAEAFALALYEDLNVPRSLRTAVARARMAARRQRPDSGTWAAYQCYGDPEFVLPSRLASQLDGVSQSDEALTRGPVFSPSHAREVLTRLWLRGQLIAEREEARRAGLLRTVDRFVRDLAPSVRDKGVADLYRQVGESLGRKRRTSWKARAKAGTKWKAWDQGGWRTVWPVDPVSPVGVESPVGLESLSYETPRSTQAAGANVNAAHRDARMLTDQYGTGQVADPQVVVQAWLRARDGLSNDAVSKVVDDLYKRVRGMAAQRQQPLVTALQDTNPSLLNDPNWGRFGFVSTVKRGREASSLTGSAKPSHGTWHEVVMTLTVPPDKVDRVARFTLHPTFKSPRRDVPLPAGQTTATLSLWAWCPFTVGVELGPLRLEFNLRENWSETKPGARPASKRSSKVVKDDTSAALLRTDDAAFAPDSEAPFSTATERALVEFALDPAVFGNPALKALAIRAAAVLEKVRNGATALSADETQALEAFALLVTRPALVVRDGAVVSPPASWPGMKAGAGPILERIRAAGRVNHSGGEHAGSGFLVEGARLLTNNHVVAALLGLPLNSWRTSPKKFLEGVADANDLWGGGSKSAPIFDTLMEHGVLATRSERVIGIEAPYLEADMAVLRLANPIPGTDVVTLADAPVPELAGRPVYLVGYPATTLPPDIPREIVTMIFGTGTELGTKRLSPGLLRGLSAGLLPHDASTLRGSSGSCVVDLATHLVLGLHCQGETRIENAAVPLWLHKEALQKLAPDARWAAFPPG